MGGYGSGNHRPRKALVEHARSIDASRWKRCGVLAPGAYSMGRWVWYADGRKSKEEASIGYDARIGEDWQGVVRLSYAVGGEAEEVAYPVEVVATSPNLGGRRPWFLCPLISGDRPCRRRCARLYLPGGTRHFGCRVCHELNYRSSGESHRWDSLWKDIGVRIGMSPRRVEKIVNRELSDERHLREKYERGGYGLSDILDDIFLGPPYPPGFIEKALG